MRISAAVIVLGGFAVGAGLVAGARPLCASLLDSSQIQANNRAAVERIMAGCAQSYMTPDLDPIRGKVDILRTHGGGDIAPTDAYPTSQEQNAIFVWAGLRKACTSKIVAFLQSAPAPTEMNRDIVNWGNSFFVRSMAATGELVTALGQGRITYAEYAIKRAEMVQEVDTEHAQWNQAMLLPNASRRLHEAEQADLRFSTFLAESALALGREKVQVQPESPQPPPQAAAPALYETPLALSFPRGADRPDDIAVIIGNGDYARQGRDIPNVRPAHADAASMRIYATQALGIRGKNIISLTDATEAQLMAVFGSEKDHRGQLYDWVKPGRSRVFIYYAGHGAPAGDSGGPYLVPTDAEASRIGLSAYPLPLLYDNLARIPAENITVVLEACFSGQSQAGTLIGKASPILIASKAVTPPANITVIAAAASDQIASWEQDESHGLFTEYFLRGMSGEANRPPYGSGRGKVTLDELDRYLKGTMTYLARRYWGRDQTAQIAQGGEN